MNARVRRHYGIYKNNKLEVIIVGYRSSTNELMGALLHALPKTERDELERIVLSYDGQSVDYLLNSTGRTKSVLGSVPFLGSETATWEDVIATRSRNPNDQTVFVCPISHIEFEDESQFAFFEGRGESIEPDIDKQRRRNRGEEVEGDPVEPTKSVDNDVMERLATTMDKLLEQSEKLSRRVDDLEGKPKKKASKKTAKAA